LWCVLHRNRCVSTTTLAVRVKSVTYEAEGISSYDLRPLADSELPPFTAGAHIDLKLPNGITRSYSLVNPQGERHRYIIAVANDTASAGGSRYIHERVRAGDKLSITPPQNNFALAEDAKHSVLIAGGIGITPIWCMVQRLIELGRSWELHYSARTHEAMAFLEPIAVLRAAHPHRVVLNFDFEPGGKPLDLAAIVANAAQDAHLYCCGPTGMLEAFESATQDRLRERVHVEYFSAKEAPAKGGGYTVVLAKSNVRVFVAAGETILDALRGAGVDAPFSCTEGVCGTCEMRVLEGVPDHRDRVLTDAERTANKTMMICCSGAKSETLVLDW
jgi:tetrachlorobenzoquinone reductase